MLQGVPADSQFPSLRAHLFAQVSGKLDEHRRATKTINTICTIRINTNKVGENQRHLWPQLPQHATDATSETQCERDIKTQSIQKLVVQDRNVCLTASSRPDNL